MNEIQDLIDVDLEYRLTIGTRLADGDKRCARYLIRRRTILIPEIIRTAREQGIDPADQVAAYAKKIHARFCEEDEDGRVTGFSESRP